MRKKLQYTCFCQNRLFQKKIVREIETKNRARLIEDCHKMENGQKVRKSKTAYLVDLISEENYTRKLSPELHSLTKQETKTTIISRFRMLECGINFRNSNSTLCSMCKSRDDEDHRLNHCIRFRATNLYDHVEKVNFNDIYST